MVVSTRIKQRPGGGLRGDASVAVEAEKKSSSLVRSPWTLVQTAVTSCTYQKTIFGFYSMDTLFRETISRMTTVFRQIESSVPAPLMGNEPGYMAFRYVEKTLSQALVQKLARIISGLAATMALLEEGFVQEIGVLQRTLDEIGEDILFLCLPLHGEPFSDLHQEYLDAFYEEEFDESADPLGSPQRRPMV